MANTNTTMNVQATADTNQFQGAMQEVAKSLKLTVDGELELIKTSEKVNEAGKVTLRTFKTEVDALNTLTVAWKALSKAKADAARRAGQPSVTVDGKELFPAASLRTKKGPPSDLEQAFNKNIGKSSKDDIQDVTDSLNKATKAAEIYGLTMKDIWRIGEVFIFKQALGLVIDQLQQGVKSAVDFQIKISEIRTLATENQSAFVSWSKSIAEVSDELNIPQIEVAKAAYEGLSAQIVSGREETIAFTRAAGNLARVGVSNIAEAGKVLASVFNAYSISANRAEEVSAKLFVAVDRGNFTIEQLGSHLGRVTGAASAMGIQFDDMLGALTTLSRTSNPQDSITQLTNVILKLQRPGTAMLNLFKQWGVESGQMAIQSFGFVGVLKKIEEATHGDAAALAEFGQELRAIRGLTGLTQGGKGAQFAEDVAAIRDPGAVNKFQEAEAIRGESPGEKLTKELNKVSNFFTNEFGQKILGSISSVTESIGGLSDSIKLVAKLLTSFGTIYLEYIVISRTASLVTNGFTGSLKAMGGSMTVAEANMKAANRAAADLGATIPKTEAELTKAGKAAQFMGSALNAAVNVTLFATALLEIQKYARELDGVKEKTATYIDELEKAQAIQAGKRPDKRTGGEVLKDTLNKESADFGTFVDNLYKPLMEQQTQLAIKARQNLHSLQEEGKEAALQLQIAFKGTTDAIGDTIKGYSDKITKANRVIEDAKKNILNIKESVQGMINDLKMDFASENQKFELRVREIQRLESEMTRLAASDNPEDIAKAQHLGMEALRQRKDLAKATGDAQVQAEKDRRTAMGRGEGSRFPDNSPITPNLNQHFQEMENLARLLEDLNTRASERAEKNVATNKQLIEQEKERERLATKRIQDLLKLDILDESGKLKKDFTSPTGKFDENKFNEELKKRMDLVNESLTEQEKKTIGLTQIETVRLNLIKQGQAAAEAEAIAAKQLELSKKALDTKQKFEDASKERIGASAKVDKSLEQLNVFGDVIQGMMDRTRTGDSWKTIGADENKIVNVGAILVKGIVNGLNKLPGGENFADQRSRIAAEPETVKLATDIANLQKQFLEASTRAAGRDASGRLTGTEEDIKSAEWLRTQLSMAMDLMLKKFGGNKDFGVQGGFTLNQADDVAKKAFDALRDALATERAATGKQQQLRDDLRAAFNPAERLLAETSAVQKSQLDQLITNTTGLQNFSTVIANAVAGQKTNIPEPNWLQRTFPNATSGGFHSGGMIHGPLGRDNLLIRAEAGEFVMSQVNTKKWLPQLIAMNSGRNPKIPGHYHEGGLVQTNVGDVNVTITGPVSPEKNVRQIGNALRRSIRRGNLDLTSKR